MKKIILSAILALNLFANTVDDIKDIEFFTKNKLEVISATKDSIYTARVKTQDDKYMPVFVTLDKKVAVIGKGFEMNSGKDLIAPLDGLENFSYGSGTDVYYLFTDPECPYCKKLEKEIKAKKLSDKIKMNVVLFPLSMHPKAKDISIYILSLEKDKRASAMKAIIVDGSNEWENAKTSYKELENAKKLLSQNMQLVQELNINGTPTIFDSKLKQINPQDFLKKLENK